MENHLEDFQKVVKEVFKEEGEYTQSELAEMMGLSEKELVEKYMTRFPGSSPCVCTDLQYEQQSSNY